MRKRIARSFSAQEMHHLQAHLQNDMSAEGLILSVISDTGLRIGDVLRLRLETIRTGMSDGILDVIVKGKRHVQIPIAGAATSWKRLYNAMYNDVRNQKATVAQWLSPLSSANAGDAAYQRVSRYFKRLGEQIGLSDPIHPHRLRRTFAVEALRETQDIVAVQQALGHRSIISTQKYLDEIRVGDVAKLQQAISKKRQEK